MEERVVFMSMNHAKEILNRSTFFLIFAVFCLEVLGCGSKSLLKRHDGEEDPSAKIQKPGDEGEDIPGYLVDPSLITIVRSGSKVTISAPPGAVKVKEGTIEQAVVFIWQIEPSELKKVKNGDAKTMLSGTLVATVRPRSDGSFSVEVAYTNDNPYVVMVGGRVDDSTIELSKDASQKQNGAIIDWTGSCEGEADDLENNPFFVPRSTLGAFSISYPTPNFILTKSTIDIAWSASSGAASYNVSISQKSDCSMPVVRYTATATTQTAGRLFPAQYYACVTAADGNHTLAASNQAVPFTVSYADRWYSMTTTNAPTGRVGTASIWTGTDVGSGSNRFLVWGGGTVNNSWSSFTFYQNGRLYDPFKDEWTDISSDGPETMFPNVVWTGTEMIVWSGFDHTGYTNKGAIYNPATNTWRSMTTDGAPATGRMNAAAVWTGTRMVVWGGGQLSGAAFNDGKLYDPVNNQWETMSSVNAPTARSDMPYAWTGSRLVVFGGTTACTAGGGDGATWTPGATGGTWSNFGYSFYTIGVGSSFAWTGHTGSSIDDLLISFGGQACSQSSGFTATYDGATNGVTALAIGNAPAGHIDHEGQFNIWTGKEMIVWAGRALAAGGGQGIYNSGAKYNPQTTTWTQMTTTDAPAARRYHAGVWAGNIGTMIVFGGIDRVEGGEPYQMLSSGGIYAP